MQALAVLDLPPEMEKIVITPQREMTVELIINRDDGRPESFMGYRVQVRIPAWVATTTAGFAVTCLLAHPIAAV